MSFGDLYAAQTGSGYRAMRTVKIEPVQGGNNTAVSKPHKLKLEDHAVKRTEWKISVDVYSDRAIEFFSMVGGLLDASSSDMRSNYGFLHQNPKREIQSQIMFTDTLVVVRSATRLELRLWNQLTLSQLGIANRDILTVVRYDPIQGRARDLWEGVESMPVDLATVIDTGKLTLRRLPGCNRMFQERTQTLHLATITAHVTEVGKQSLMVAEGALEPGLWLEILKGNKKAPEPMPKPLAAALLIHTVCQQLHQDQVQLVANQLLDHEQRRLLAKNKGTRQYGNGILDAPVLYRSPNLAATAAVPLSSITPSNTTTTTSTSTAILTDDDAETKLLVLDSFKRRELERKREAEAEELRLRLIEEAQIEKAIALSLQLDSPLTTVPPRVTPLSSSKPMDNNKSLWDDDTDGLLDADENNDDDQDEYPDDPEDEEGEEADNDVE